MNVSNRISGHGLVAALLSLAALSAAAELQAREPIPAIDHESRFVALLRQMPEADLKAFYLQCSQAAIQGSLGNGETALCSIGYETLLNHTFGGDFLALHAWSRSQPIETPTADIDRSDRRAPQ